MRQEFNIPVNAKVALMVARFVPSKRHDVLLGNRNCARISALILFNARGR